MMTPLPLTVEAFREVFPAFTSALYPDAAVASRLALAARFFSAPMWDDPEVRQHVMGLYTAHHLEVLGRKRLAGAAAEAGHRLALSRVRPSTAPQ